MYTNNIYYFLRIGFGEKEVERVLQQIKAMHAYTYMIAFLTWPLYYSVAIAMIVVLSIKCPVTTRTTREHCG